MKKRFLYSLGYIALIVVIIIIAFGGVQNKSLTQKDLSSSDFTQMLKEDKFSYVLIVIDSFVITR